MPVKQLVFVFACLAAILSIRRILGTIVMVPTVFLYLLLGIGLGAAAKAGWAPTVLVVVVDKPTLQSIGLLGWLGSLTLVALGSSDTNKEPLHRKSWAQAIKISIAGFGGTFLSASALGYLAGSMEPRWVGAAAGLPAFAMAIGLASAVTAMPVLVSMLYEREEESTHLGKLAIRIAAIDDIWMWFLLIVVTGMIHPEANAALHAFMVIMLIAGSQLLLRPALAFFYRLQPDIGDAGCVVAGLSVIIAMAILSESVGTHALFGAFISGVALPCAMAKTLRAVLLPTMQALFLPFFFITIGLQTDLPINNAGFLMLAAGFTVMGVGLKMTFVTLAGHYTGLCWADALRLGSFLQCKGLMEIVVLGLMRDAGIIGPEIFSALFVMALACTALTMPLDSLVRRLHASNGRGFDIATAEPELTR